MSEPHQPDLFRPDRSLVVNYYKLMSSERRELCEKYGVPPRDYDKEQDSEFAMRFFTAIKQQQKLMDLNKDVLEILKRGHHVRDR